jgi:hypothetical protein
LNKNNPAAKQMFLVKNLNRTHGMGGYCFKSKNILSSKDIYSKTLLPPRGKYAWLKRKAFFCQAYSNVIK